MKELTHANTVVEMIGFFGLARTATLIGYCAVLGAEGLETRAEIVRSKLLARRTAYRVLADIHAFRDELRRRGYDVTADAPGERAALEEVPDPDVQLVRLIGRAAA